ncbi:MAG: glutathione S-transferase family protein [Solirubrobacterales bacterium]
MRMDARLYVIPGSHPALTARLMLEHKGIAYERTDLMPVVSKGALKLLGFPGVTVPALKIDGRKIQGSKEIARELDRIQPEPPLFPADPSERAAVEEAERFGDEDLQPAARRMLWWALKRDRAPLESFSEGAKLGIPIGLAVKTAAPIVALANRFNEGTDENVRADLAALPGILARVDDYIAAGTLGGEQVNAGDLQVGTSLRLMMSLDDLRPLISARPSGAMALRVVPEYPGRVPPILPDAWLAPLREADAARTAA